MSDINRKRSRYSITRFTLTCRLIRLFDCIANRTGIIGNLARIFHFGEQARHPRLPIEQIAVGLRATIGALRSTGALERCHRRITIRAISPLGCSR